MVGYPTKNRLTNQSNTNIMAKKTNTPAQEVDKPKTTLGKKIAITLLVLFIISTVAVIGYGFHLDRKIQARFNGQIWQLPAVVYSRILHLSPGAAVTQDALLRELDMLGYQKVIQPKNSGEYTLYSNQVELIRRPFTFEDGKEDAQHVRILFDDQGVTSIEQLATQKGLGFLRIEPKMLGMLDSGNNEQRIFLARENFPEFMVDALVNTEDRNFYHHHGVSPIGILRAFIVNLRAGKTVQGGSTLTQQLAKNMFLSRDRTLVRKAKEAYMALIIDYRYSKDQILEAYVNEVYLGQSNGQPVHGFPLGARLYFGRPIEELRTDQLAMLVGMVKGPSYYNPWRYPERIKDRRDVVLKSMMEQGKINSSQYVYYVSKPLDIREKANLTTRQPAYFDQLRQEITQQVGGNFDAKVGLRVFSTLDPLSQMYLEQTVSNKMADFKDKASDALEVAAFIADRQSGEIRAMVGGSKPGYAGFNRALDSKRQIGSLAKPAIYLTALENHQQFNLATPLKDQPIKLKSTDGQIWEPKNYDRKFRGEVSLIEALAKSYNIPAVNLGMTLGIEKVISSFEKLGATSKIAPLPSTLLGTFAMSPKEVTQIYQTLASGGQQATLTSLRAIVTQDGDLLYRNWPTAQAMFSNQASWLTMYGLKQVVKTGTAKALAKEFAEAELAGKTGTTDDNRDSWYVGIDGREVVTIWLGRDDNKPTPFTGSSGALKVYADYIKLRGAEKLFLTWPAQIETVPYRLQQNLILTDCTSIDRMPVWDANGFWREYCKPKPAPATKFNAIADKNNWLDKIFN